MKPVRENTLPAAGRTPIEFRPGGRSMHPFIRPGDRVTFLPLPAEKRREIRPGECVVFLDEAKRWVVHRVIAPGPGPENFLIKGDALARADRPAEGTAIAGRVTAVERAGSGKTYRLDLPLPRLLGRLIAFLSRGEAALFSACYRSENSGKIGFIARPARVPRWLLTRIFFP